MSPFQGEPSAGYKFNTFEEIRSHSAVLFNQRLAILFFLDDTVSIKLHTTYEINDLMHVKAILIQLYKNIRTLVRNNPTMRATLNLDTKDDGIYITDVSLGTIENMVRYCQVNGYTLKKLYIIVQELDNFEMMMKDILQYYHYFIRPDFRQKPDIDMATEAYKEIADKATVNELYALVGKRNIIDFEGLGSERVELQEKIEYDDEIDEEEFREPKESNIDETQDKPSNEIKDEANGLV